MCTCSTETEQTDDEKEREREGGGGVCACWERPRKTLRGNSWRLNKVWELYFGENKVAKGVCNVAKLATLYFSISPTTGWAMSQTENTRCVNHALIKLVPLKGNCVNALLTFTALNKTQTFSREQISSYTQHEWPVPTWQQTTRSNPTPCYAGRGLASHPRSVRLSCAPM